MHAIWRGIGQLLHLAQRLEMLPLCGARHEHMPTEGGAGQPAAAVAVLAACPTALHVPTAASRAAIRVWLPPPAELVALGSLTVPSPELYSSSLLTSDKNKIVFTFIWTTPPPTFTLRCRRAVESALFHHPDATVYVYSNSLPF